MTYTFGLDIEQRPKSAGRVTTKLLTAQLVEELTRDLNSTTIDLLGYPEVSARLQAALNDDRVTDRQLAALAGSDPVLASRILGMANSVAFGGGSDPIIDLNQAIVRIGTNALRGAVMAHSMAQLRSNRNLAPVAAELRALWQDSVLTGALCNAIAHRDRQLKPDTALLAGLLHGVGKLYVLTKACNYPDILATPGALNEVIDDWHSACARALLEQWGIPPDLVNAVGNYEYFDDSESAGGIDLAGALYLATVLVDYIQDPAQLERLMNSNRALTRLGLSAQECEQALAYSERRIAEIMSALDM